MFWAVCLSRNLDFFQRKQLIPQGTFLSTIGVYFSFKKLKRKEKQRRLNYPNIDKKNSYEFFDGVASLNPNGCGVRGIMHLSLTHMVQFEYGLGLSMKKNDEIRVTPIPMTLEKLYGLVEITSIDDSKLVVDWMEE
jgi:hypothetical protein